MTDKQLVQDQLVTRLYRFGDFTLDAMNFRVLRRGDALKITPRAFEVLLYLAKNAGRVVGKQEIFDNIWGESFVTDNALTRMVKEVRQVLGDSADAPSYIETIPKRGYRFIMPVDLVEEVYVTEAREQEMIAYRSVSVDEEVVELEDDREDGGPPRLDEPKELLIPVSSPAMPGSAASSRLAVIAVVLAAAVLLGLGGYFYFARQAPSATPSSLSVTRLTANGKARLATVSPDGRFLAFATAGTERQSLWLKNVNSGTERQIAVPPEHTTFGSLTFSPDGDFIYYLTKGAIYKLSVLGDTPRLVKSDYAGSPITLSPDGKRFAYLRTTSEGAEQTDLVVADAETGVDIQTLATSHRPNLFLSSPTWSPDGTLIACSASRPGGTEIVTVNAADGTVTPLPLPPSWSPSVWQVLWKPDGKGLFVAVEEKKNVLGQIWSLSYPGGEAVRLTDDSHNYRSLSVSANGRYLTAVRTEQEAHLWLLPGSGDVSQAKQLTSGFEKYDGVYSINWVSSDKIVYANAPSGRLAIWQIAADGSEQKEVWPEGESATASPDGQYVVYRSSDDGGTGLFRASLKDGEKKRLTIGEDESPTFSPDGKWVVFTRFGDDIALWKVPAAGGSEPTRLTDLVGYPTNASVSPDGKYIAFYRGTNGPMRFPQLAVVPFDGGPIVKEFDIPMFYFSPGNANSPVQWSLDGTAIYHIPFRPPINIWRQPVDGSAATQVTNFENGIIFNYAFSPDGKQLVVSRGTIDRDVVLISPSK